MYELVMSIYFVLENLNKIVHLLFNFDACPVHSSFGFVQLIWIQVKQGPCLGVKINIKLC